MPAQHSIKRRIQFSETDLAGVVHFSNYFRMMEEVEHAFFREMGLSVVMTHEALEIGWPRVSASCDFHRPLRFEQEFDVYIRVTDVTKRTISYSCEMTQDGQKIATGSLKIACVRKGTDGGMRSIDIPPEIAARFCSAQP